MKFLIGHITFVKIFIGNHSNFVVGVATSNFTVASGVGINNASAGVAATVNIKVTFLECK
jgi:hypothetical protein